ncbi:hypothetical protein [Dyella caseinilytica]|uniref:DUF4175 domain-containing protein n=1 Tax=Dyella caseinilytica TaxID=1849581 RepID=A0ABX7GQ39_9GAMM|nr:hypothetical protein [Dyella caseinilytica]QRN52523.1 hypothetical protein ISN74_13730 [Dyella caseinilytica]GGA06754.1 hypothetical protein GCM10011408_29750 [Dyella caseinilytica]
MSLDKPSHYVWRIWAIPAALAVVISFGLLSALLGDRLMWKGMAWFSLAMPIIVAGWLTLRRRRV